MDENRFASFDLKASDSMLKLMGTPVPLTRPKVQSIKGVRCNANESLA